ncbi:MAG: ATP-binding cassette domain-containing protein [Proteobacteria bacterium]|nr:ATP-binding cassette domain-containing protein [Pseudomonadota bacterium]NIS70538.1 ATP-binding cassette domain-containing protein [Pseudomonadota bacterium]
MSDLLLDVRDVNTYYGHIHALKNISVRVGKGSLVSVIGANGAGKTTFLKTIMGVVQAQSGKIYYDGDEITRLPTHKIVKIGISLVPEGRQLFGPLSVLDNLALGTYKYSEKNKKEEFVESANQVYRLFPILQERTKQKAGTLSGGQQQMLAIGRALMSRPQLLLLDEPSLGLAPMFVREIMDTLVELRNQGITIVLVEQNARLALKISDYCFVLDTGKIATEGPSRELMHDEELRDAYLGKRQSRKNR